MTYALVLPHLTEDLCVAVGLPSCLWAWGRGLAVPSGFSGHLLHGRANQDGLFRTAGFSENQDFPF